MLPKKRLPLEGKPPNSTIMRSREHCIADRMTGSSSAAYHKRRQEVLQEAHDGMWGAHQPSLKLRDLLRRLGYYWPKMIPDAITYAKRCHACQV